MVYFPFFKDWRFLAILSAPATNAAAPSAKPVNATNPSFTSVFGFLLSKYSTSNDFYNNEKQYTYRCYFQ